MQISKNSSKKILFLSVLINVFFIGFFTATHFMRPPHGPPPHGRSPIMHFEKAKHNLSADGQAIVEKILKEHKAALHDKNDKDNRDELVQQAEKLLSAPNFDPEALLHIHNQMDAHIVAQRSDISDIIYKIAVELSDEDRVEFFNKALPKQRQKRRK